MNLTVVHNDPPKGSYVTPASPNELVASVHDFLDLSAWAGEQGTNLLLLAETNLPKPFYDLSTRMAGEMLQKVSNYHLRLAIVGAFDSVSDRFREFMRESNKGWQIRFAPDRSEAVGWLLS